MWSVQLRLLTTVLGTIRLRRGYYYCGECGQGVLPRDEELDIVGTSFSPGVRRMMGRMGGKESFNEARGHRGNGGHPGRNQSS
ncbi:MAG: hypothetical protein LC770_11750 [Acidobacteria bacterium]|nr:hypothetical protein [Acidobacteriota bacterium]